jgi:IS30 family transposase
LIAGRLPVEEPGLKTNYESIYLWVYADRRDLIPCLAQGHKNRHKRVSGKGVRKSKIPDRVDISERPAVVNERARVGDWEADTVVSRRGKGALAVFVERKTRFYTAVKMKDKSAGEMFRAAVKALGRLPAVLRKTITYDNGSENVLHREINEELGTSSYFCKPYHSWEKGSVENRNGQIRKYFEKRCNFCLTNQKEVDYYVRVINDRPMKCLRYRTPNEVFVRYLSVALRN